MSDEEKRKQQPDELMRGIDAEGFFTVRIHKSQGLEKIIGVLMTSIDMVKAHYIQEHQKAEASKIVKPNGLVEPFKNKWH